MVLNNFWNFIDENRWDRKKIENKAVEKVMNEDLFLIWNQDSFLIVSCLEPDENCEDKNDNRRYVDNLEY